MPKIIAFLLVISFLLSVPVWASPHKEYLAVFGSLDMPDSDWEAVKPDLLIKAPAWTPFFDIFLKEVKEDGHGKPIVIDISVHGWDKLALYQSQVNSHTQYGEASMGYVVNHIEKALKGEDVTVCCEACFGGYVYKHTIRGNVATKETAIEEDENCDHIPSFPIYGVSENVFGWNNVVWQQYVHSVHINFQDLRSFEFKKDMLDRNTDMTSDDNRILHDCELLLSSYGVY